MALSIRQTLFGSGAFKDGFDAVMQWEMRKARPLTLSISSAYILCGLYCGYRTPIDGTYAGYAALFMALIFPFLAGMISYQYHKYRSRRIYTSSTYFHLELIPAVDVDLGKTIGQHFREELQLKLISINFAGCILLFASFHFGACLRPVAYAQSIDPFISGLQPQWLDYASRIAFAIVLGTPMAAALLTAISAGVFNLPWLLAERLTDEYGIESKDPESLWKPERIPSKEKIRREMIDVAELLTRGFLFAICWCLVGLSLAGTLAMRDEGQWEKGTLFDVACVSLAVFVAYAIISAMFLLFWPGRLLKFGWKGCWLRYRFLFARVWIVGLVIFISFCLFEFIGSDSGTTRLTIVIFLVVSLFGCLAFVFDTKKLNQALENCQTPAGVGSPPSTESPG